MKQDLDGILARLSAGPVPPALGGIEDAVFARIDAAREVPSLRIGALAAIGAVAIGLGSAAIAPSPAQASAPGIDASVALAPSTLLGGLLR